MDTTSGSALQSHPFTCNSCQVAFRSSEAQRSHMRSDWHRYNLKRRVASLPPLSSEVFNEKVLTAQATTNAAAAKATFEKICVPCQKTYFSENAYQNHIGSQKHKVKAAAQQKHARDETGSMAGSMISSAFSLGEPINAKTPTTESGNAEEEFEKVVNGIKQTSLQETDPLSRRPSRPHHSGSDMRPEHPLSSSSTTPAPSQATEESIEDLPLSRCLFCNYESPTLKLSILHMSKIHGLFIPEQNYLVDLDGLIRYLQAKIHMNKECTYCHKLKNTTGGIQTHMRDKGHCMIAFETEDELVEIGQFYDFSSTYSDDEDMISEDTETEGGAPMTREGHEGEDDGWETDSSASSLDSDEVSAVPIDDHSHQYSKLPLHRHHSHTDPRPHKNADGFHSHAHSHSHAAFYSDHELHLPSGRTAGHRSLNRYFRQNLHNYPTPEERLERAQRLLKDADGDEVMGEDHDNATSPGTGRRERGPRDANGALITRSNAGLLGATEAQKRGVKAAEKRDKKVEQRERNRYQAKLERQNNFQKHFRDPLLQ